MKINTKIKLPNWCNPNFSVRYLTTKEQQKRLKFLHLMREHLKANTSHKVYLESYCELTELFLGGF